ncbi:hypothetical protein TNCV_4524371 [Trichonephila clavipes]|nr:hypothetical protein TNCV_4524371 [Trichonephila clavipes]
MFAPNHVVGNSPKSDILEGTESVDPDKRSGCPQTSSIAANIDHDFVEVCKKRPQIKEESVRISSATRQMTLAEVLIMHRMYQHIVSRMLNED